MASDTDALQRAYRLLDIVQRYIVCDVSSSYFRRHHKTDFSAFEFLVQLQCGEYFLARKIWGQTRRQFKSLQKTDYGIASCRRQLGSFD